MLRLGALQQLGAPGVQAERIAWQRARLFAARPGHHQRTSGARVANPVEQVTVILRAVGAGEEGAQDRLYSLVYEELRRVASNRLAHEGADQTLDATGLVHETFLRLVHETERGFVNRLHFFSAAAESMRRILIDRARKRRRLKRGGDRQREPLVDVAGAPGPDDVDLLALDEALGKLEEFDERKASVVKLRYFLGLTTQEAAELLGVATRTVDHEWRLARAWLRTELAKGESRALHSDGPESAGEDR